MELKWSVSSRNNGLALLGKDRLKLVEDCLDYCYAKATPGKDVTVHLIADGKLRTKKGVYGRLQPYEPPHNHEYDIEVDARFKTLWLLDCIVHEYIHVRQYESGDLVELGNYRTRFRGIEYNTADLNYYSQPWEIDAYGCTPLLIKGFLQSAELEQEPWANYQNEYFRSETR